MRRVAALLAVTLPCAVAHAEKHRGTAEALSGVGVGVSSVLVLSSFLINDPYHPVDEPVLYAGLVSSVITPSLGEWYAGEWLTPGMAVRVAAVGLATFAVAHEQHDIPCDPTSGSPPGSTCKAFTGDGVALLGIAAIAYIGGAAWDVENAGDAVDRANQRTGGFALVPTALATPTGLAPGLYFSATY